MLPMIKVSIIVPVHDSARYLHKCVASLLGQTLEEIQIILVDDCSSDNSPALIADYVRQHPGKVTALYLPENLRQGGARNRGMELAEGEYIAFVDSDDFVEPDMCRALYEAARGADMCGASYYVDDGKALKKVDLDYGAGDMDLERKALIAAHCGYFWSRIYKKEFLLEFGLKFPEKVFFEDAWFNFMTILYARSAVHAPGRYYHYYQSPDSTIRGRNKPHHYERIGIPSLILSDCKARGIYEQYKPLIEKKYISMQLGNVCHTCLGQFDKPEVAQLQRIRRAVRAELPGYARHPEYRSAGFSLRTYFRLTMLWPRLAVWAKKAEWFIEGLAALDNKLHRRKKS